LKVATLLSNTVHLRLFNERNDEVCHHLHRMLYSPPTQRVLGFTEWLFNPSWPMVSSNLTLLELSTTP
jgi:hypothetical protein